MQDLKTFTKIVFTLKSGVQTEILVEEKPEMVSKGAMKIHGFEATPLIVKKTIIIEAEEIALTEITKVPHIVYGLEDNEVDIR